MANPSICIRFTDETYATKSDVQKALGITIIDSLWNSILVYRNGFTRTLGLKSVSHEALFWTRSAPIYDKINSFDQKLSNVQVKYSLKVGNDLNSREKCDRYLKALILTHVAAINKANLPEQTARAMVSGFYRENSPEFESVLRYLDALNNFQARPFEKIDENLLAANYTKLLGTDELTSFYREADARAIFTTATVSKVIERAPAKMIDSMMENLWSFLTIDGSPRIVQVLAVLYFLNYVKPFDSNNAEMASLLAKAVLYKKDLILSALIPLEKVLVPTDRLTQILAEVQKTNDLTYFILYAIDVLTPAVDAMLDQVVALQNEIIKKEQYVTDKEAQNRPTPVEPAPIATPAPKKVEVSKKKEDEILEKISEVIPEEDKGEAAFHLKPTPTMSDKEAKENARYIVETNPNIRKPQALFYVTHCTIGRYYSIQDFKKATKCAYETARTSMDNLARQGYYTKLQIKNKFVYTPVKLGEKE